MPVLKERLASLERIGDRISANFLSKVVGRESRGDDLLGSERMSLRTSSEDTGWRTELGVPENCLVGKGDMGDEARVLAMDS